MLRVILSSIILMALLLSPIVSHAQEDLELAQISLENVDSLEPLFRLDSPYMLWEIAVSADKIAFTDTYAIYLWDFQAETGPTFIGEHSDVVHALLFTQDGKTLISGAQDNMIKFWDTTTGELLTSIETFAPIKSLALDPEEQILATGHYGGTITLWDVERGKQLSLLDPHLPAFTEVSFGASSDELFSASGLGLLFWDTKTEQHESVEYGLDIVGSNYAVDEVVFNPAKNLLGINHDSGSHYVLELKTGISHKLELAENDYVYGSIAISPDGTIYAAYGNGPNEEGIFFWSTETGKQINTQKLSSEVMYSNIDFSPDGIFIVTSDSEGVITVWAVPQIIGN